MSDAFELAFEGNSLVAARIDNGGDDLWFRFNEVFELLDYAESTKTFRSIQNEFLLQQVYSSAWGRLPDTEKRETREKLEGKPDRVVRYVSERGVYLMTMTSSSEKTRRFQGWPCRGLSLYSAARLLSSSRTQIPAAHNHRTACPAGCGIGSH